MKKAMAVILSIILVFLFSSCGGDETGKISDTNFSTIASTKSETVSEKETKKEKSSEDGKSQSETGSDASSPSPSPVDMMEKSKKSIYGKNTGTDKTYTGLEPLPEVTMPVTDVNNLAGLSEKTVSHSYGVSVGGKPHDISVNFQKTYSKYGGICLDTSGKKVIYLTFDCGYENGCTAKILDTLKEKNVPAAFFVTLPFLNSSPEIAARMINEGHTVGNHSDTHPNFSKISRTQMVKEIETVDNCLRQKFGYSSPFFRFPEGAYSECALELVQSLGYTSVFWSSAYADWDTKNSKGAQYAFNTVTSRLHPGCVLLLHAVSYDNAEALGDIIDWARNEGYEFKAL